MISPFHHLGFCSFSQHRYETQRPELRARCRECAFSKATFTEIHSQTKYLKPSYHSKKHTKIHFRHARSRPHVSQICWLCVGSSPVLARLFPQPFASSLLLRTTGAQEGHSPRTGSHATINPRPGGGAAPNKGIFLGCSERHRCRKTRLRPKHSASKN